MKSTFELLRTLMLCVALILLTPETSLAQKPTTIRLNAQDSSQYFGTMRVDQAGVVRALYNVSCRRISGSPEQVARAFLAENSDLLQLPADTAHLVVDQTQTVPGGSHVRFAQVHAGISVFRGDIVVSLNENGQAVMVINNFNQGISLRSMLPAFDSATAIDVARRSLNITGQQIGKVDKAALTVYRTDDGTFHLAYRVLMTNDEPLGDWEVFVDAHAGDVLHAEDRFVAHSDRMPVQGTGYVFLPDPLSASRRTYAATGFVDAGDADTDSLTHYRQLVTLDSLTFEDNVYKLTGRYCHITDIEPPADPAFYAAATPDGFQYTRSEQGFEAVNAYYHITTAYTRLLGLGFSCPSLEDIRVDPHGLYGEDNSHYSPSGNWIAFGEGGVDDAEDADVIWHEYGHAIQYNIVPTWGGGESGALGEGFGDYLAGSFSRSLPQWFPPNYQYNWVFNWDGHNPFWSGRILNDSRTYPFGNLPIHDAGQIWSSTLMGIQFELGRDITERLAIKSLFYLGSGATGPDNAYAMIQADRDLYGGTHVPTLLYWLGTLKHFIDPVLAGPRDDTSPIPLDFYLEQNYPNPFNPTSRINFSLPSPRPNYAQGRAGVGSITTLKIYDLLGREVATLVNDVRGPGRHQATFDAGDLAGGTYFYVLRSGGLTTMRRMVLLR